MGSQLGRVSLSHRIKPVTGETTNRNLPVFRDLLGGTTPLHASDVLSRARHSTGLARRGVFQGPDRPLTFTANFQTSTSMSFLETRTL